MNVQIWPITVTMEQMTGGKDSKKQTWSIGVYKCWRILWVLAIIIEIMKMILLQFKDFQQEKSRYTRTHTHTHTHIVDTLHWKCRH